MRRDPARRADPDRRRPRSARRSAGDLRRALRPDARARRARAASTATRWRRSTSRCGTSQARQAGVPLREAARRRAHRHACPPTCPACRARRSPNASRSRGEWHGRGFRGIKYAAVGVARGRRRPRCTRCAPRSAPDTDLMVDLHWRYSARRGDRARARTGGRAALLHRSAVRARGRRRASRASRPSAGLPVAAGEEWRNVYEARLRLDRARLAFVQPEMGAHRRVAVRRDRRARRRSTARP